jgi:hypothetical protein
LYAQGGDPGAGTLSELDRVPELPGRFAQLLVSSQQHERRLPCNARCVVGHRFALRGEVSKHPQSSPTVHVLSSDDDSTTTLTAGSADTRSKIALSSAHMLLRRLRQYPRAASQRGRPDVLIVERIDRGPAHERHFLGLTRVGSPIHHYQEDAGRWFRGAVIFALQWSEVHDWVSACACNDVIGLRSEEG